MLCVDTSILVAALTDETATERSQTFLAEAEPSELAIDAWVITEFSSALSIKVRTGQLAPAQRNVVLREFTRLIGESFEVLPVSLATFVAAARLVDQHAFGLRAGDALHLAVAIEQGAMLASLDKLLVDAGAALGASTRLL
jgi:predicted nucleic acid-binding protein